MEEVEGPREGGALAGGVAVQAAAGVRVSEERKRRRGPPEAGAGGAHGEGLQHAG